MRYLLEDWSAVNGTTVTEPTTAILDESVIIEAIDAARKNGQKIKVFGLKTPLLDWTEPSKQNESKA